MAHRIVNRVRQSCNGLASSAVRVPMRPCWQKSKNSVKVFQARQLTRNGAKHHERVKAVFLWDLTGLIQF